MRHFPLERERPKHIQVEPMYALGWGRGTRPSVDLSAFVERFHAAKRIAEQAGSELFFSAARANVLTNRFCRSSGERFSITPSGLVSACYEVPGADDALAEPFIFGRYDPPTGEYRFDQAKLAGLREHTVERIPWCAGCFCTWHCAGDCMYKPRYASVDGELLEDPQCEVTRADAAPDSRQD